MSTAAKQANSDKETAITMFMEALNREDTRPLEERMEKMEARIEELETASRKTYYKQSEVLKAFGIGHTTLKKWVAQGLREIWIDNRVYYDIDDIRQFFDDHKI